MTDTATAIQNDIARLRALFPLDYKPEFKLGDIIRLRKDYAADYHRHLKQGDLGIVVALREDPDRNWPPRSFWTEPWEDVALAVIETNNETFEGTKTADCLEVLALPRWLFELVESAPQ